MLKQCPVGLISYNRPEFRGLQQLHNLIGYFPGGVGQQNAAARLAIYSFRAFLARNYWCPQRPSLKNFQRGAAAFTECSHNRLHLPYIFVRLTALFNDQYRGIQLGQSCNLRMNLPADYVAFAVWNFSLN
ncbi:hypothetical protein D3C80_1772020 [compost metagenome]